MSKSSEPKSWHPPRGIDPDNRKQIEKVAAKLECDPADVEAAARVHGGNGIAVLIDLGRPDLLKNVADHRET